MEASIPKHRRWIPVGMEVAYLNKATTDLSAICDLNFVDWETTAEVPCFVEVKDTNDSVVVTATIKMKVSINGSIIEITQESIDLLSISELPDLSSPGLAVAVNQEVIPKSNWNGTTIMDGDTILIIKATQGG